MIIQRKYQARPICKLLPIEVNATAKALCFRIAIITGWTIPPEKNIQEILFDQLAKFLNECYPTLNHEEIEYAFRTKPATIKDWGKSLNLGLFTEVLEPYLSDRKAASELELQVSQKIEIKNQDPVEEMTNQERIEAAFKLWKLLKNWEFIFQGAYQALYEEKLICLNETDRNNYMSAAKAVASEKLSADPEYFFNLDKLVWLRNTARKLAVNKYFESLPS